MGECLLVSCGILTQHETIIEEERAAMERLLEVRDLEVRYETVGGQVFALCGASFSVGRGEIVGVLGESGSGKSTLGVSLLAMLPGNALIESGAVFLQGRNLVELGRRELEQIRAREVSLIFQEPSLALHPMLRVGSQIEEVLRAHGTKKKSARRREVLTLLDVIFGSEAERIYRSYPHQLSGGQRQRIAIAQAIICKPGVLIADEPTASLDSVTQREILELLKKLQNERGLAIVFITHAAELLEGFADRVMVMYGGRIVEEGLAGSILRSPRHPYTQALLNCRPAFEQIEYWPKDAHLPVIQGEPPDPSGKIQGCAFVSRCPEKMPVCSERMPDFTEMDNGGRVRCFKFGG